MSDDCPTGWDRLTLGELGDFSTSSVDKKRAASERPVRLLNYMDVYKSRYLDSSMNFMEVTATTQEFQKARVSKGDMFFTPSSETPDDIGHSAVFMDEPADLLHSYHTVRYRLHDPSRVDLRYRGRMANSETVLKHFSLLATGSTRYTLSLADFRSAPICLPPSAEQQTIADVLDTLDTAIHETEAIIGKLKAVKQGLLHDLLTRGIDANGELRPPQPEAPHLYKQSPLGWIPREWGTSTVATEFEIENGITLGPHRIPRTRPWKYLRVANVHRGRLVLDEISELEASNAEVNARAIRYGDLLLVEGHASTSEIGRCAMADESISGMLFQNHLFRLRSRRLEPEFGLLLLNSQFSQAYWRREAATSSGLNTINRTKLGALPVVCPPREEQLGITERGSALATRIDDESRLRTKLCAEKSGLMDDLLTGRVRVTPLLEGAAP